MKLTMLAMLGMVFLWAVSARGQVSYTNIVNASVPDGSPLGLVSVTSVSGVLGTISDIQVNLDITGGFNGDLYAYLLGPQGNFAVLLNRVGMGGANPFGNGDAGFNITLSDGANNVHSYADYVIPTGQLTGTWAPDGRNISPGSSPAAFDSATINDFTVFNTTIPNGNWTLFIADLSGGGGQSTLVSWGLTIVTVPEPQSWLLSIGGGVGLLLALKRRRIR